MENIYIVIPTYNEKGNIEKLLPQIFDLRIELKVLVVDDNSPDGTGKLVEQLKQGEPRIEVLHREKKEGLGLAYLAGFTQALNSGADLIFEMDADLSHDPKHIPNFLEEIKNNDLVLGSRYCPGGGVANWNAARRVISRFGNLYAKSILRLPYTDLTGGFKCYNRKALQAVLASDLSSLGYNFQIESTYFVHRTGLKIVETPIVFTERTVGKSKFNLKIILEGFWKVFLLALSKK